MDVIIRSASQADLPQIMEIERASFSVPWSEKGMAWELAERDTVFNAAASGEEVWGFAILRCFGDEGELYNLAVREERRGQGVGKRLLQKSLRDAASRGVRRVFLEVRKSNLAARSLYKSCGFTVCGERKGYYEDPSEDATLMDWEAPPV